jgi:SAM-dependent methyltransferase
VRTVGRHPEIVCDASIDSSSAQWFGAEVLVAASAMDPAILGVMSQTYADVDGSANPTRAVEWQERVDAWPAIQAYKRDAREQLRGARRVLDVGCGPGEDVASISRTQAVGLDSSWIMCTRAATRIERVILGDAHALPFRGGAFDGVRADRVLQHLADPELALREMVRVTHAQGRVVIADPDQETLSIHVPGISARVADRLKELRRDTGYRNGTLARELPDRFASIGLSDIAVEATTLVLTDPDDAFGLPTWPHRWKDEGGFSDDDIAAWDQAIDQARRNGMIYAVTYFVVSGTRP